MINDEEIIDNEANEEYVINQQSLKPQLNYDSNNIIKDNRDNDVNDNKASNVINSPIEIRKKETIIDDASVNIELKNKNEFIHMDHFDEASKIGFGINDYDNERTRIKVLSNSNLNPGTTIHKRIYNKKGINFEEEDFFDADNANDEEESSKYTYNINNNLIDYFQSPINHLNQRINQYHQLSKFNTFKCFIQQKMRFYISKPELKDEFMNSKPLLMINREKDDYNKTYNSNNTLIKQKNGNESIGNKSIKLNQVSAYYSPRISSNLSPQKDIGNNFNNHSHLFPSKSQINFNTHQNSNPTVKANLYSTKQLEKDNIELKEKISEVNNRILQIQSSNDKKSKELQKKNDKLTLYINKYDSLIQENQALTTKIENMQIDINIEKNDGNKKTEKISELQKKISALDQDHRDLLKIIELESTIFKETKQNYELFKGNYIEIKNQYDLLNIKYQSISDENFNYKRDLLLYEKELKNKNEMIDKLRNNLLDNAKYALNNDSNLYSRLDTHNSTVTNANMNTNTNTNLNPTVGIRDDNHSKSQSPNRKNNYLKNAKKNKGGHSTNKSLEKQNENIQDNSNKEDNKILTKSQQVKFIEIKISKLNKERNNINNDLNKLPVHPKKKNAIEQKKEMEIKIEQLGSDLVKLMLEMKRLKADDS